MNGNPTLRTSELASKYLERTSSDIEELRELIARVPLGEEATYRNIEILAHRIRGSGAMFGFELISDAALGLETIAIDAKLGLHPDRHAVQTRLRALARVLDFIVRAAKVSPSGVDSRN